MVSRHICVLQVFSSVSSNNFWGEKHSNLSLKLKDILFWKCVAKIIINILFWKMCRQSKKVENPRSIPIEITTAIRKNRIRNFSTGNLNEGMHMFNKNGSVIDISENNKVTLFTTSVCFYYASCKLNLLHIEVHRVQSSF